MIRKLKKYTIKAHNFLASIMSIMFLMWFISGIVLIFAGFPHASKQKRFEHLSYLTKTDIEAISSIPSEKGDIELEKYQGKPIFRIYKIGKKQKIYNATNSDSINFFGKQEAILQAEAYTNSKVSKVVDMQSLDQWIPWSYYSCLLPMHKCYVDDNKNTIIYVSSKTGSIIQNTSAKTRFLAYIGAIPHWIYLKSLRLKVSLWINVVIYLSSLGLIVSVTGIIAGIIRIRKRKKRKITPYKKFWYKWHHIFGFCFGIFTFTFILSGLISVSEIPQWILPRSPYIQNIRHWNQKLDISKHKLTPLAIWNSLEKKDDIRKISWHSILDKQYIFAYHNSYKNPEVYLCKDTTAIRKDKFSEQEITLWAQDIFPNNTISINTQEQYDEYYKAAKMYKRILPVYVLSLNDKYNTHIYINPKTAETLKIIDNNKSIKHWLYRGLHTFDFPFINKHQWLRKLLLIIASIGGILISITGLILAKNYFTKLLKKHHD